MESKKVWVCLKVSVFPFELVEVELDVVLILDILVVVCYVLYMSKVKDSLRQKSNEVLQGILVFLSSKDKEIAFEDLEKEFPTIKGKQLGSLFSGITRTLVNGNRLTISIPQFGSRRKVWKLNKDISSKELDEVEVTIKEILEERK